jgi:hypothetical protein
MEFLKMQPGTLHACLEEGTVCRVLFFRPDETMIAITGPSLEGASSLRAALAARMPAPQKSS